MNIQRIAKFIWEEFVAFLAWAMPTLWNMFAESKPNEEEIHSAGDIYTEDGHVFTMYSDGTTETGPGGPKKPLI